VFPQPRRVVHDRGRSVRGGSGLEQRHSHRGSHASIGRIAAIYPGVPAQCNKLPTSLKQFGGVVGGHIIKDKLFFFGGYRKLSS
jgi:hypothetical protein